MEASLHRALTDKAYDKRKGAALEVEKVVREATIGEDVLKLSAIISQLCELAQNQHSNARSGGIMGLAAASIALGPKIATYLGDIVPPVLACFNDADSKVRYFACESMYNVAKVAKGEILIFFNELFDAMSKLAADTELPVKNGAELLDRLIKDIVTEEASTYVSATRSTSPSNERSRPERAFSLPRFIPLLRERIYVLNPFTRTYLVSWLTVLDSVPELELVSFLPDFLDGLLKFLGDPTVDIRTATQNVLADFLREIREVAEVAKMREDEWRERAAAISPVDSPHTGHDQIEQDTSDVLDESADVEVFSDEDEEGSGEWIPGQGVIVDHAAIVEILLQHSSFPDEEIQSTCLRWIAEFLLFVQPTMVSFAPRLIPVVLSSLAHHVGSIRTAANETNYNLYKVIQDLPTVTASTPAISPSLPPSASTGVLGDMSTPMKERTLTASPTPSATIVFPSMSRTHSMTASIVPSSDRQLSARSDGPVSSLTAQLETMGLPVENDVPGSNIETDPIDYGATVNALTLQFLNEHEETRVAALEWLLMLHQKAPQKILADDDLTGQNSSRIRNHYDSSESGLSIALLLKMLSDSSEKVLRCDLQLLAQISSNSEDEHFPSFMMNLLSLFSTDRKLLETRGSLIIRQLCVSLNTERIYRTFAEILEKDEDLEFASIMVQNLNLIMITSPELAGFRKRLKTLESKDGQTLFTILYRSWSHNAVATFSLCLLAQAYEQACSLLQIFADLEITVSLLIQIDKLVQLIESPVFTSLRLQLLEPDRYPFLLRAMYGLLMLLPQSSAFATLRNRLSAVSQLGFLHTAQPKTSYAASATRSTVRRDDIRWTELLTWFRQVQVRHERSRRPSAALQNLPFEAQEVQAVPPPRMGSTAAQALKKKLPVTGRRSEPMAGVGGSVVRGVSAGGMAARPSSPSLLLKRRLASKP